MEENKVMISLEEYIKLYEGQKKMQLLLELIFNDTELTSNNNDLKFDYYNSKLMRYLKEKYPDRYKKQIELLKEEED